MGKVIGAILLITIAAGLVFFAGFAVGFQEGYISGFDQGIANMVHEMVAR
jgi:hypothetical protein